MKNSIERLFKSKKENCSQCRGKEIRYIRDAKGIPGGRSASGDRRFMRGTMRAQDKSKGVIKAGAMLALVACLIISCAAPVTSMAMDKTVKYEIYKAFPQDMTIDKGKTKKIKKASKYCFTMKGKQSFQSISEFISGLDGCNLSPKSVKWISKNKKIAKVDSKGKVTAVKKGKTYIYPVPKDNYSWRKCGRYIVYTDNVLLSGLKFSGGIGIKVQVKK